VSQLLETFGSFDADDDGVIEPAEFYHLWEHLGAHKSDGDDEEASAATEEPKQKPGRDLRKIFDRFDVDNNGILDHAEVKGMMLKLGYKTTDDYVEQTMQLFASFDQDSDGMIQLEEFEPLWDHLGGDQILSAPDTGLSEADSSDPLYERFASFDLTGTGFLTRHEIQAMMAKLGYAANDQYLSDLLGLFGSFDKDGDGCVDFEEWKGLWAHLGGEDAMGETDEAAKAEANAHEVSDPLWATFVKYDKTGSKSLSGYEVKQMMVALGYKADEQYVMISSPSATIHCDTVISVTYRSYETLWLPCSARAPCLSCLAMCSAGTCRGYLTCSDNSMTTVMVW
jgi:Ca2+-binding EF-hand superfamily protein